MKHTIGFIGGGNMAHSLIGGLIANNTDPQHIYASDSNSEKLHNLQHEFNIHTLENNQTIIISSKVVVLAVKPQHFKQVALEIANTVQQHNPLIISIAAGIRTNELQNWLGDNSAIVRCMPNVPALVGCGATGLFANKNVSEEQRDQAEAILRSVGTTIWLEKENLLDVVTALSGCGPAYFFLIMEALEQSATQLGLSSDEAHLLTLQTALGAARMAISTSEGLIELRQRVTSPGGSTEQALKILENGNIRNLFSEALKKAQTHAAEMAKQFS
jgi:pyrroline-5-carboxylate reductase